jgi:predicted ester cyclase
MVSQQEENKALIRALYNSLMAHGDTATAMTLLPSNFIDHDIPGLGTGGPEDLIQAVLAVRAAFPDITPELYDLVAEDDRVAVRVEAGGTHTGEPFNGIPASGRAIRWKEIHIFRCASGQIVEHRGVFDLLGILQQLGALPAA